MPQIRNSYHCNENKQFYMVMIEHHIWKISLGYLHRHRNHIQLGQCQERQK